MKHVKFLILLIVLLLVPATINAYDLPVGDILNESVCVGEASDYNEKTVSRFFSSSNIPFEEYIISKCLNFEKDINVYSYNLSIEEFEKKYFDIALRHPELMVVTKFYFDNEEHVGEFSPLYLFDTKEEITNARNRLLAKISEYKALVEDVPTDLGKLTILHDKIAYDYSYEHDYNNYFANEDYSPYHPVGFLLRGKAVCEGYASLLYKVLEEIGIESDFCISNPLNHIWNYIKLDGEWYHTDITWNDQTAYQNDGITLKNTVYHAYFLRSDSDFVLPSLGTSHGEKASWIKYTDEIYNCTSTKYEKNHLFNIPVATTIFYNGSRFVLPYTNVIIFESETPFVGEIVLSRPYGVIHSQTQEKSFCVVQYCVGDVGREYISYMKKDSGAQPSFRYFKGITDKAMLANYIPRNSNGDKYSIYCFDAKTLAPLCRSMTFTDN